VNSKLERKVEAGRHLYLVTLFMRC